MSHFIYQHLPAHGLGHRDPRRAHVTGGISGGVLVVYIPPIVSYEPPVLLISNETVEKVISPYQHDTVDSPAFLMPVSLRPRAGVTSTPRPTEADQTRKSRPVLRLSEVASNEPEPEVSNEPDVDGVSSWEEI